jgi:surfeit locus 1 family protein
MSPAADSHRPLPLLLFGRRWWWTTVLVVLAIAFLARLGFWQLDRLEQRRAANAELTRQLAQPPLLLDGRPLPAEPAALKDRQATVTGHFDFARQVALTQRSWQGQPGIHLLAPLVLPGGRQAVLVDRGWLPLDEAAPAAWSAYDQPGELTIAGYLALTQPPRTAETNTAPRQSWYRVDIAAIERQLPYELLPLYLRQAPGAEPDALPYRAPLDVNLSEGPHLSYAVQWFLFAAILGAGYLGYVARHRSPAAPPPEESDPS